MAALGEQLGFRTRQARKSSTRVAALVHARGRTWGQLIFQDVFKKEQ